MNYWIEHKLDALCDVLKRVDGLFVNDAEARLLTGQQNMIKALSVIHGLGPRVVVVKRGEFGALLSTPDGIFCAPAYPVEEVRDPTGAGDSFAGGFMGFLARSSATDFAALKQAVLCGTIMASFSVECFGPERFRGLSTAEFRLRARLLRELTECQPVDTVL